MRKILALCVCLTVGLWAQETIKFNPQSIELGKLEQGETKKVSISVTNTSAKTIDVDMVLSQNSGSSNFKYPKSIAAGKSAKITFDFNSAYMANVIEHRIILVDKQGNNHIVMMNGSVNEPIMFSNPIQDIGFYTKGEKRELKLYAWSKNLKALKLALSKKNAKGIKATFKAVKLDIKETKQGPEIKEGGATPAYEITLNIDSFEKKTKSIRELVAFTSKTYPKATPEIQIIGYWK